MRTGFFYNTIGSIACQEDLAFKKRIMNCANCHTKMNPTPYEGGVVVDACSSCGGMYLDGGELEKVQEIRENDYSEELAKRPPFIDRAYEMARQKNAPNKICPKCLKEMHRREWLGSQILIDVCSDCFGVWLDKGELQDLEQYFERLNADLGPEMERMLEGMESGKKRGFWASFKSLFEGD